MAIESIIDKESKLQNDPHSDLIETKGIHI